MGLKEPPILLNIWRGVGFNRQARVIIEDQRERAIVLDLNRSGSYRQRR